MNLRRKLLAGYGVMLGLLLLLGVAALFSLHNLNGDLDRATRVTARKQFLAGGVNAAASEMTSLERGSVLAAVVGNKAHSESYQQQFKEPQQHLQDSVAELRRLSDDTEGDGLLPRIEQQAGLV